MKSSQNNRKIQSKISSQVWSVTEGIINQINQKDHADRDSLSKHMKQSMDVHDAAETLLPN